MMTAHDPLPKTAADYVRTGGRVACKGGTYQNFRFRRAIIEADLVTDQGTFLIIFKPTDVLREIPVVLDRDSQTGNE